MRFLVAFMLCGLVAACASRPQLALSAQPASSGAPAATIAVELPSHAQQGSLVFGRAPAASRVEVAGRVVRVAPDGRFVFGVARDAEGTVAVQAHAPGRPPVTRTVSITPRTWSVERINGVPPSTVNPPPAIAARIKAEQARVSAARVRDDARIEFLEPFLRPVEGRVSGRFGHQRVYNGSRGAPHSGMDIAASTGTPVRAPAGGVVTFADPGLYLTGGTVVLDHGHGVSSNFLHLSRIDVRVGQRLARGERLGAVGATGRATGPHLHWGMNWFDTRIDPETMLGR